MKKTTFGFALVAVSLTPLCAAAAPFLCSPADFGGKGDGVTLNTRAIQQAIDLCAQKGGGKVTLGSGVWLSGPIALKSNVRLVIPDGVTLKATPDTRQFVDAFLGRPTQPNEAFILANGVSHVAIEGGGTIDGNGAQAWWPAAIDLRNTVRSGHPEAFTAKYKGIPLANGMPRPWLVEMNNVSSSEIHHIRLTNSPMWNLVLRNSHQLNIDQLTVDNPITSPNTDGIDIVSSTDILIKHADISTGDDHIAIKSGITVGSGGKSENITVQDSVMRQGHGISLGSETINGIGNVVVSHVRFIGAENGLRVKSGRDRGNKIGPFLVDHVTMTNVATPLLVTDSYSGQAGAAGHSLVAPITPAPVTATTPFISGITVNHLAATGAKYAMILSGLPEAPITDVNLHHIAITAEYGVQARYVTARLDHVSVSANKGKTLAEGPAVTLHEENSPIN
ncbi:MAG: glycosyl hydrolase family 28 protein [Pantoea sp.]|uniref:glycoside hydrolase family 28 protein n=1 Tax=Pantoea sp. TaxID=69393 RepID=UPI0039E42275